MVSLRSPVRSCKDLRSSGVAPTLVDEEWQDSVARLVAANAAAYQTGYEAAYVGYQDLSKRHIAELKKPRIRLGSALGLLGAAGMGLVVGRVVP